MIEVKISPNNSKLGNIASFSIPSVTGCPGATEVCKSVCYAEKIERIYKNAAKAYEINLKALSSKEVVSSITDEINKLLKKKKAPTTFRWNVSGDIVDIRYLNVMKQVMNKFPNMTFYAYTRNWSIPSWKSHLNDLKKCSNFTLFASLDDEHLSNNILPDSSWRVAYFGNKTQKEIGLALNKNFITCPNQLNKSANILCDTCKYCFNPKLNNTTNSVYFIKH